MNSTTLTALGLLILRIAIGVTFLMHGIQKIFVNGAAATAEGFAGMGVPLPEITGPATGYVELVGGVLLILGLGTRIVAVLLAVIAFGALFLVHLEAGFYAAEGGIAQVFVLGLGSIALLLTGPGRFAVDAVFAGRRARVAEPEVVAAR